MVRSSTRLANTTVMLRARPPRQLMRRASALKVRVPLALAVIACAVSLAANAQNLDCGGGSHLDEMVCAGKPFRALDAQLNRVYKLALAAMPEKDEQDRRKDREQLRKSERAWLVYVREQCALEGGLQGGSNSWVSTFAEECQEKEFSSRIEFLQSIANHTFGG